MFISIEEVPHSNPSRHRYFVQVAPLSLTAYNRWGYNNIRIKEEDQWKGAFKMHQGLFEPKVMFFGMSNSPASFQCFMNGILEELYKHFEK